MDCEILETLYIKSNGDVPCNDDAGESVLLGKVQPQDSDWSIEKLFCSAVYGHIRACRAQGKQPWAVCSQCAFMRAAGTSPDKLAQKQIRKVQLEPSLCCNLACPCCNNKPQLRERPGPHLLPPELVCGVFSSLAAAGYGVSEIEYCGQGEPLMHPQFGKLTSAARRFFPHAHQRLITNGNFACSETIGDQVLEEIIVSCDGAFQESYERYRVNGDLQKVFRFMREAKDRDSGSVPAVIWKYILFEFNDSEHELMQAQHIAQELGVDALMFVFTHSRFRSLRYPAEAAADLPVLYPNVVTSCSPIIENRTVKRFSIRARREWLPASRKVRAALDEAVILHDRYLTGRGWLLVTPGILSVSLRLDGRPLGKARTGIARPDVFSAFPEYGDRQSGFAFSAELPHVPTSKHELTIIGHLADGRSVTKRFELTRAG